uniref:Ribonuclease H-like domain-containing protein n=1 Tax=Tanacetum cinerariifolium TaxID=118510 RepID=A0A699IPY5_TANCI|nr:ribonuclease H-like domain-containing protein [Tanacetum cinerariifolium]
MPCDMLQVWSNLLTRDPLLEVTYVYTTVSREESHREILESSTLTKSKLNPVSFAAKVYKRNNNASNSRGSTTFNNNSKLFVGFNEDTCYIQDLKRETVLGISSESGGLYLFNMDNDKFVGMSIMVMSFNVSKDLWHNRLGHPANQVYQVLYVLKNDMHLSKSVNVTTCEIYHRAKQSREPFPLNDHKSEKLGELIHLDLWGLYKVYS